MIQSRFASIRHLWTALALIAVACGPALAEDETDWSLLRVTDDDGRLVRLLAQQAAWDGDELVDRVFVLKVTRENGRPVEAVVTKRMITGLAGEYAVERVDYGFGFYYHDDGKVQAFTITHYPASMQGIDFIYDAYGKLAVARNGRYEPGDDGQVAFNENASFKADTTDEIGTALLGLAPATTSPTFDDALLERLLCWVGTRPWEDRCPNGGPAS